MTHASATHSEPVEVDYLIIGAGMAGTVLHRFLQSDDCVILDPRPAAYKVGESIIPEHFHHPELRALVEEAKRLPSYAPKAGITFVSKDSVASFPLPPHGTRVAMHVARHELEGLMHRRWETPVQRERVLGIDLSQRLVHTRERSYRVRRQILDCSGPAMVVARHCGEVQELWPTYARWAYYDILDMDEQRFWDEIQLKGMSYRRFDVPNGRLLEQREDPDWQPSKNTIITQVSQSVWTWQIPLYGERVLSFGVVSRSDRIDREAFRALAARFHAPHYRLRARPEGGGPMNQLHLRKRYARRAKRPSTEDYILVADACAFGDPLYSVGTGMAVNKAIELAALLNEEGWSAALSRDYNQKYEALLERYFAAFETWYRGELLQSDERAAEIRQNFLVGTAFQVGIATHYSRVLMDAGASPDQPGPDGRGRHQIDPQAAPLTERVLQLLGAPAAGELAGWSLEGAYQTPREIQQRWAHPDKETLVINTSFDPAVTRYYRRVGAISLSFMNLWDRPYPLDDSAVALFDSLEQRIGAEQAGWMQLASELALKGPNPEEADAQSPPPPAG